MKAVKKILIVLFISTSFVSFSQNTRNINDKDLILRQSLAAKYLKENYYNYKSAEAKASHNIILDAFVKNSEVIKLNIENISESEDKLNLNSFIGGLNSVLIITPSWQDLVKLEKEKLLFEDKANSRTPQLKENKAQQK